LEDKLKK